MGIELPVTSKLTLIAAGRRSYSDIYRTYFAKNLFEIRQSSYKEPYTVSEPSFHFYDLNAKVNYRISDSENLSFSVYGGKDKYINKYSFTDTIANADSSSLHNYGISLNWQKQWDSFLFTSIIIGSSGFENQSSELTSIDTSRHSNQMQPASPDTQLLSYKTKNKNNLQDFSFTVRNTLALNSSNILNFGFHIRWNTFTYHKNALKGSNKEYIYDNIRQSSWVTSFYAQDRMYLLSKFIFKPGFRLTYYNGDHKFYFEPRLAAQYKINENWSLSFTIGKYFQFLSQVSAQQETGYSKSFWALSNDSLNPVMQSNHYITGINYRKKKIFIDIEAYYKNYSGQQEYVFASPLNPDMDNIFHEKQIPQENNKDLGRFSNFITGKGKSYGFDFYFGYKSKIYLNWFSYTLSLCLQKFNSINHGNEFPALTDQRHQLRFCNLFIIGKWNIGAIALYATGKPYYIHKNDYRTGENLLREYKRLPEYFRLDLSGNYSFTLKKIHFKTGLSIINLFNNQNYFDVNTKAFQYESTALSETNLVQSQKLSLNLFFHVNL